MDIKRKTCVITTWEKHLFLDISSTNNDTLIPSVYQCVETRSIKVFLLLSQPFQHLCFNLFVLREIFATKVTISLLSCEPLYATNTPYHTHETFLYEYRWHVLYVWCIFWWCVFFCLVLDVAVQLHTTITRAYNKIITAWCILKII
jgi:hypothetical protein